MVSEEIKMEKKSSHIQTTDKQTTPSYKVTRSEKRWVKNDKI